MLFEVGHRAIKYIVRTWRQSLTNSCQRLTGMSLTSGTALPLSR
jgi:hypothetical protein